MKKFVTLFFIFVFAFALVGCGGGDSNNELKQITISGKSSIKVGQTVKYELKFTPENYADKSVDWTTSDEQVATVDENGNVKGVKAGSGVYIVATSKAVTSVKGQKKISVKDEQSGDDYPDLQGYTIKLAYAEQALGDVDPNRDDYTQADRKFKLQALDEIQNAFNCQIVIEPYPSSAPWGPSRWSYIKQQAAINEAAFDFYNVPDAQISGFVDNGALIDLSDFYAMYGNQMMDDSTKAAGSYNKKLYRLASNINIDSVLYYNVDLYEKLKEVDSTLQEPAQMFLDGNWSFETFENYIVQVQEAMATKWGSEGTAGDSDQKYFAVSGWSAYYFAGFASNDGIPLANTSTATVDLESENKVAAAESIKKIYNSGCADPKESVDGAVVSWNEGRALFNTGSLWFVGNDTRWPRGNGVDKYGYVPWPSAKAQSADDYQPALGETSGWVMPIGRDYSGYGDDCTAENIFWAVALWFQKSEEYYKGSAGYDENLALQTDAAKYADSEASQEAYMKVQNIIKNNGAYFDPLCKDGGSISSYYTSGIGKAFQNDFIKQDKSWSATIIDLIPTLNSTLRKLYSN